MLNTDLGSKVSTNDARLSDARTPKYHNHDSRYYTEAEINGIRGFLVWDFIVYNEITFDDAEGNIMSFFTSMSDDETEAEWNRLVRKYGVKTD